MGWKILILFVLYASPTLTTANIEESFAILNFDDIFGFWNNITTGWSHLASLISTIQDIFSIFNENHEAVNNEDGPIPVDAFLNITELGTKYGYPIEEHEVITEDGYILGVHRLKGKNVDIPNKVVFLMHGILESSDSWILQGPDSALGYILADKGFDVWMGNARGNKHALRHRDLDPKESDFWEFTWEEIGIYDLPAMINYVLNATGNNNLYYVGYSQGSTSFYVMESMKPEYNEKIKMMFSLAPVAWMENVKSPIVRMFSPANKILGYLMSNFNTKSPSADFFNKVTAVFCSYLPNGCKNLIYMIEGKHTNVNSTLIPVILGHMPTGSSAVQFVHYGQLVNSGRFSRYDFGEERNLKEYGKLSPPDYNLTKVTVPIEIFYSDSDWLSDGVDVDTLRARLPNVVGSNLIRGFNHMDYIYSWKAKQEVYDKIIFKIYENKKLNYTTLV